MTKKVDFIFDFGSPNAYLSWKVLPDLLAETGARLNMIPCLLGGIFKATDNQSPFNAFSGVKGKLAYERLEMMRFVKKHGLIDFQMNPHFPVNTLLLMRAAVATQMDGGFEAYLSAGFRAMWEDGLKMDDPDVFARVMTDAGFDGQALIARTQDAEVKAQLIANTEAAVARGVFGIPSFFVGEEMFFGKDRLDQVADELAAS